jgi:hypothetical protein
MTGLWAAQRFFTWALRAGTVPVEVTADPAPVCPRVPDELVPPARHTVEQQANNPTGAEHRRLKARSRPAHGLKRHRSVKVPAAGHTFAPNLRRNRHDIAAQAPSAGRPRTAFDDSALTIRASGHRDLAPASVEKAQRDSAAPRIP